MKEENRRKQVEKMIYAGLNNLYMSQEGLDFDQFSVTVLEALMLLEREEYLKAREDNQDIGNGIYERDFRSLRKNSLQIKVPRTRSGKFKPMVLELINEQKEQVNELALLLYRKGLSSRDVSQIMEEYFGESLSRDTVNNLAESFHTIRLNWENSPLDAYYKVIYCDALWVNLKRGNSFSKEAVHVIYGVKDDNTRELLLLEVNPTEGSSRWGEYLAKLNQRGINQIDLIVADGLVGFSDVARIHYPEARIQRCVVHLARNMLNKIRPRDKEEFSYDLKQAFNNFERNSSKEEAVKKLEGLVQKWGDSYGKELSKLIEEEYISDYLTYIEFPIEVRRLIYTTNSIENLNRQIRKVTKTKVSFNKESNLLDLVYMIIKDFEAINWQKYPVTSFAFWPNKTQSN
jgi:putative transposase